MKKNVVILLLSLLSVIPAAAQNDFGGVARFDRTVYDFGKINTKDGAVSCNFDCLPKWGSSRLGFCIDFHGNSSSGVDFFSDCLYNKPKLDR